jgi:hypothetical protein
MKRLFLFTISAVLFAMFSDRLPAGGHYDFRDHVDGEPATLSTDKNGVFHYRYKGKNGVIGGWTGKKGETATLHPDSWFKTAHKVEPESKPSATPKPSKEKPTESPADSFAKLATRFDGTWVATNYKSIPAGGKINGIYTIVIRDGKTAAKTLDTTNVSSPESADNEIHRKWTCSSTDLRATSSSVTIQWSAGELADWAPRTISREEIQSYGNPNAETSVYQLKGDELTRINDPNGVTYHRVK